MIQAFSRLGGSVPDEPGGAEEWGVQDDLFSSGVTDNIRRIRLMTGEG
jgi:hypothetical protein